MGKFVINNLGYLDEPIKEEAAIEESLQQEMNACFMENVGFLIEHADDVLSSKEYSNVRVPMFFCGLMYADRHRPLTLGELLFYYKHDHFIFQKKSVKKCCKIFYGTRIIASPLSGTSWVTAFCPECKNTMKFTGGNGGLLMHYLKGNHFEYEQSPYTIMDVVKNLKDKIAEDTKNQ